MRVAKPRMQRLALAVALACAHAAAAPAEWPRDGQLSGPAPQEPRAVTATVGQSVARIVLELPAQPAIADGRRIPITVRLLDANGQQLNGTATVTLESSAGHIASDAAAASGLDPRSDGLGTPLQVTGGEAHFWLITPARLQDIHLRVTAGNATAEGMLQTVPDVREMIAVGLIEGAIGLTNRRGDELRPARIEDGFEQEIRNWSRRFSDDRGTAAVRGALFLKGKIRGDALLTMAYDSDKDTYRRLLRDALPDVWYPVYGDDSAKGFDAQSASKLYVRIDQDRNYLLYGDFVTSASFSPLIGGHLIAPLRVRDLGQYNRTLTGVRTHWENGAGFANVFAARDTLRHFVEEYAANGTSGPFAVAASGGIIGTEKVEVVVRDRNNVSVILAVTPLAPLVDYVFEPFSGRLLLNRPLPSRDPLGNPQSLRVSYEVDQGGDPFWIGGVDGQWRIADGVELGGSWVEDRNPLARYRLLSVNGTLQLAPSTRLIAELARSEGSPGIAGTAPAPSVVGAAADGFAARIAVEHDDGVNGLRLYAARSDVEFSNPAASFQGGRGDAGLRATHQLNDWTKLFTEIVRSEDRAAGGTRTGAQAGSAFRVSERLSVDVALKRVEENGLPVTPGAQLPGNPASATGTTGAPLTPSGGFYGGANPLDPSTGAPLAPPPGGSSSIGAGTPLAATTMQLGAQYRATDAWTLAAEAEHAIDGDDQKRLALGAAYQWAERTRLYGRFETQRGLASVYSLNPADRSTWFVFGADTHYAPGAQFYSEYRISSALGDPLAARDAQLASGLRNTWQWREGVRFVSGAEYLRVFAGGGQEALALTGGVDLTADPLWKALTRLEWRRMFDVAVTPVNEQQDSWLSTVVVARKLDRDWTLLTRNYLLYSDFAATGARLQDRFQIGLAYRDAARNRSNALAKYEFKVERDRSGLPSAIVGTPDAATRRDVHVVSVLADWHPSRAWWLTGRVAAKSVDEAFAGVAVPRYNAGLIGGRAVVDITERFDIGVLASGLFASEGRARQTALGLELGGVVDTNLRLSVGFNFTGFNDRDLTGSDYTARGVFIRLRFKFDEELLNAAAPLLKGT